MEIGFHCFTGFHPHLSSQPCRLSFFFLRSFPEGPDPKLNTRRSKDDLRSMTDRLIYIFFPGISPFSQTWRTLMALKNPSVLN